MSRCAGVASGVAGREAELGRIELALDQTPVGPAGLCLEGAPGSGKATAWRAAVLAAEERGYRVLVTAPAEPDASLSFASLGDLFVVAIGEVTAALPDPQRRALTAALSLEEASEPTAPEALPRAVLTVIRRLAAEGPLVVAIDDEEWLDQASARVLAFALSRLRDEPVCVVLARRSEGDSNPGCQRDRSCPRLPRTAPALHVSTPSGAGRGAPVGHRPLFIPGDELKRRTTVGSEYEVA